MEVFLLVFLVAASHAAPSLDGNAVPAKPLFNYVPVLENAPVYPNAKIVEGRPASSGLLPYQAALFLDGRSFCGGSLIASSWILTAAHCTLGVELVTAQLGSVNLNADEDGTVVLTTRGVVNHPHYNSDNFNNDVALVHLPGHTPVSHYISPVSLPSYSHVAETFENHHARVSGWGRTSDDASGITPHLNYLDVNVISNSLCARTFGTNVVVSATICTSGNDGQGTCRGDSGGPLVTLGNHPTLIGVISFVAKAGCASGNPSGYMRVTSYLDWIHSNSGIHIRY